MSSVYISLGSNLGDRKFNLDLASERIEAQLGSIEVRSAIYETEPWGFQSSSAFLNRVVKVETLCGPEDLMSGLLMIETLMGRKREGEGYESRVIDIDILLYEDRIVDEYHLKIPHPRMHLRKFVLVPMAEIAGRVYHPVLMKTMEELLAISTDRCIVRPYKDESVL